MTQRRLSKLAVAGVLAAGMVLAQDAPGFSQRPEQGQAQGNRMRRGNPMGRLAADLNLTDAQKAQAAQIFQASRQEAKPVAQQLRQYRQDLAAAVKSGAAGTQIDQVTAKMGPLVAQVTAIHAKACARFYATLTPEQQQKVGSRMDHFLGGGMMGPGMHRPAADGHTPDHSWRRIQQ